MVAIQQGEPCFGKRCNHTVAQHGWRQNRIVDATYDQRGDADRLESIDEGFPRQHVEGLIQSHPRNSRAASSAHRSRTAGLTGWLMNMAVTSLNFSRFPTRSATASTSRSNRSRV